MFLVATGLVTGLVSAALAVASPAAARGVSIPWGALLVMFAAILVAGMLPGLAALISALRTPLLPALRSE